MVFIAGIKVEPLPGSQMEGRGVGGFVYCLIPANSKNAAKARLRAALEEDKYRLVQIELFEDYQRFTWEKSEDQIEYDRVAKMAALNDEVVYGPFYTWNSDG
jgi:thioester reductase-like protein